MKGVWIHGFLALVGLVAAYVVWTTPKESDLPKGDVTVFNCDADDLKRVTLAMPARTVLVEPKSHAGEDFFWFKVVDKAPPAPHGSPQPAPPAKPPQYFVGNPASKTFIESFAHFKVLRSLGKVDAKTLKEFELDKASGQLNVQCGRKELKLSIGGKTYGTSDRYVKAKGKPDVYLLSSAVIGDLENSSFRFMQRALHLFQLNEVDSVHINTQNAKREFTQRNRQNAQKAEWVDAAEPTKRNELYGNWLRKLVGMGVESYLNPGQTPSNELGMKGSALTGIVRAEYRQGARVLDTLEFVKAEGAMPSYYAKTQTTKLWVKLIASAAKQVEDDLAGVLGRVTKGAVKRPPPQPKP